MNNLNHYVDGINRWNNILGIAKIEFPLTQVDIGKLADKISCQLSPENLHCDGEISPREAKKKYDYLMAVRDDLVAYAKNNGMLQPQITFY